MTPSAAPGEFFNFAQHLLALNTGRAGKTAYVDDHGTLTYGALDEGVRRAAAALLASAARREERVLLLMHDSSDWVVAFLGALYAGVVPVAVNTLLTVDDYAYMLQHSRAQAVLVSGALLPVLQAARVAVGLASESGDEVRMVVVSHAQGELPAALQDALPGALPANSVAFDAWLQAATPLPTAAPTRPDDPAFWLYSSGSTGRPKGTVHTHANPWWTAELYGKPVLGMVESDICFSAAKLFFAYGLGNALSFPLSVGATVVLMAERPTPDAVFKRWLQHQPTVFFGAPTGFAGMLAAPTLPPRSAVALRLCSSAGEALPADLGQRFTTHFGALRYNEKSHLYDDSTPRFC